MLRWSISPIAIALTLAALCSPASARPKAPGTAGDEKLAEQYYRLGSELYKRSNYEGALEQFKKAYAAAQKPDLLYNIARCNEALGKHGKAIAEYRRYLKTRPPDDKEANLLRARVANLQRRLAKQEAEEKARRQALTAERQRREAAEHVANKAQQREARERGGMGSLPGWITLGAGVAFVVAGTIFASLASGKQTDLEQANRDGRNYADVRGDHDAGKTLDTLAAIGLFGGAAIAAAGGALLTLHFLKKTPKETENGARSGKRSAALTKRSNALTIAPSIIPGGAYLGARFSF